VATVIQDKEPTEIIAGDTLAWTKSLSDYPANDTWVLSYYLRGPSVINITTTASGANHAVSVLATVTTNYIPGEYTWVAKVTKGTDVYTVGSGKVTITQNMQSISGQVDLRSDVQIAYDNAMTIWKAVTKYGSYSIAGRTYTSRNLNEIIQLVEKCKRDLMVERMQDQYEKTGINPRHIKVRFNR